MTNNNERVRWMPINDGLTIHGSAEGHGNMHYDWDVPFDQSMDAWVGVYGGRVHFIVSAPSFHDDGTYEGRRPLRLLTPDRSGGCGLPTDSYPSVGSAELPLPDHGRAGPASTSTRWRWSSAMVRTARGASAGGGVPWPPPRRATPACCTALDLGRPPFRRDEGIVAKEP